MNRALPLALGVSLGPALGVYALVSSVPAALGTAAVYVGAAYFYFAFDVSLLAAAPRFDDRSDRLGYGVGLFGLSVTPILFAQSAGGGDAVMLAVSIAFFDPVIPSSLTQQARRRRGGGE